MDQAIETGPVTLALIVSLMLFSPPVLAADTPTLTEDPSQH